MLHRPTGPGVPEGIADLVRDCLRKDPAARPSLDRVLERSGADDTVADGRALDPWLPSALVANSGGTRCGCLTRRTRRGRPRGAGRRRRPPCPAAGFRFRREPRELRPRPRPDTRHAPAADESSPSPAPPPAPATVPAAPPVPAPAGPPGARGRRWTICPPWSRARTPPRRPSSPRVPRPTPRRPPPPYPAYGYPQQHPQPGDLASRDANSGTRQVFQRRVLGRGRSPTPPSTASTRTTRRRPSSAANSTTASTVADLPGAIGYSELNLAARAEGLHSLRLDGDPASADAIEDGTSEYPYRELEYAYTYGRPPADSLASSFLTYLSRGNGQDVIRTHKVLKRSAAPRCSC
ncbi:hypothetical protein SVIOM74S_09073 [Streptomyces violarus]